MGDGTAAAPVKRPALPALGDAMLAARATLQRFPLVMAAAVASATSAILTGEDLGPAALQGRLCAAATLGLPLLTAATCLAERWDRAATRRMLHAAALLAPALVYIAWPGWTENEKFLRFTQLAIAAHLLVAFVPFLGGDDARDSFWQYNRLLFERFLSAALSTVVLYGGLALALAALDRLFGVDVPDAGYFRLWVTLAFVFNTWFFLGGVPRLSDLENHTDYPAALRGFAQYILVPLVALYLVILTLYLGKVLVTWDWPSGWIGWLVSGVATAGIFAQLLVHPIAEQPEQRWVRTFARDFWLAILPAVVMLWLAIYQRINQYGMTEPRYFLLVLSVWLAIIAVYFRFVPGARILRIPVSLCALAVVTFVGPWSAYRVAERSQARRLETLLTAVGILEGGRITPAERTVSPLDAREINATVRYLLENHGPGRLARWLPDSTLRTLGRGRRYGDDATERVVAVFGVRYVNRWLRAAQPEREQWSIRAASRIDVAGFDVLLRLEGPVDSVAASDTALAARYTHEERTLRLTRGRTLLLEVSLDSLLARLREERRGRLLPAAAGRLAVSSPGAYAVFLIERVHTRIEPSGVVVVESVTGDVLVATTASRRLTPR